MTDYLKEEVVTGNVNNLKEEVVTGNVNKSGTEYYSCDLSASEDESVNRRREGVLKALTTIHYY